MTVPTAMVCPKCRGQMMSYERNGITIDQCAECRGVFLDRGELERLIDAEAAFTTARRPEPERDERPGRTRHHDDRDQRGPDKRRKRGGFLDELFD
jgi:Zn-finger nucleic acid-binding protein